MLAEFEFEVESQEALMRVNTQARLGLEDYILPEGVVAAAVFGSLRSRTLFVKLGGSKNAPPRYASLRFSVCCRRGVGCRFTHGVFNRFVADFRTLLT
jgi:hypothetical protein